MDPLFTVLVCVFPFSAICLHIEQIYYFIHCHMDERNYLQSAFVVGSLQCLYAVRRWFLWILMEEKSRSCRSVNYWTNELLHSIFKQEKVQIAFE